MQTKDLVKNLIARRTKSAIFISAVLLIGHTVSYGQVTPTPPTPRAQEQVRLQIPQGQIGAPTVTFRDAAGVIYNTYDPRMTLVSMAGNQITVSVQLLNNGFGNPSQSMDLPLGEFPTGTYSVQVLRRLPDGTPAGVVGNSQFTVAARASGEPLWNNSDIWWNPSESGWGLSLAQHGSGVLFGAWFVYGADNKPIWYVIPNGTWTSPSEYRGTVYRTTGPYFGASTFDSNAVSVSRAGSAVITFDAYDANSASVLLDVDGVTQTKSIHRQPF